MRWPVFATRAALFEARLASLERLAGLPRRVPVLSCEVCAYTVAELATDRPIDPTCPRCGYRGLLVLHADQWPPGETEHVASAGGTDE